MGNPKQSVEVLLNDEERIEDDIAPLSDEAALRRRVTRQIKKRREFYGHLLIYLVMCLIFFGLFTTLGIPWVAGIIALAWGSGVAAQAVDLYFDSGKRAAERLARMHQAYRNAYGPRWHEKATQEQLISKRAEVDGPVTKRVEFYQHAAVYLCINLMLWFIYLSIMPGAFPWPVFVSGTWGIGLISQANEVFSASRSKKSIDREVERQRALIEEAQWGDEKPKNDFLEADDEPAMTVGPDGELVEIPDETDEEAKQKRG